MQMLTKPYLSKYTMFSSVGNAEISAGIVNESYTLMSGKESYPIALTREYADLKLDAGSIMAESNLFFARAPSLSIEYNKQD